MPYPFRMPEELRAQVNAFAKANSRSVNTELVLLLHEALAGRNDQAIGAAAGPVPAVIGTAQIDVDRLADAIAERVATKLKIVRS